MLGFTIVWCYSIYTVTWMQRYSNTFPTSAVVVAKKSSSLHTPGQWSFIWIQSSLLVLLFLFWDTCFACLWSDLIEPTATSAFSGSRGSHRWLRMIWSVSLHWCHAVLVWPLPGAFTEQIDSNRVLIGECLYIFHEPGPRGGGMSLL